MTSVRCWCLCLAVVLGLLASLPARAATFVVTSSADTAGSSCGATCTLRQAITAANATTAADTINFDIDTTPPRGDILIQPGSSLPPITQPLTINGYSQGGTRVNDNATVSNATLRIRLDGGPTPNVLNGLAVCASNTTVRGLAISRFLQNGLVIGDAPCAGAVNNVFVLGNFIGLANSGTLASGNVQTGIRVASSQVRIGGTDIADRNVISANGNFGILLRGTGNLATLVQNNLIGTDRGGSQDFGNGIGIRTSDTIGTSRIVQNLVRFNGTGIHINGGSGHVITQNRIHDNDALGIDLGTLGPNPNDVDDLDNGPNGLQNTLEFTASRAPGGGLSVSGFLDVGHVTQLDYSFEFFASPSCDPSGFGEGERFVGATVEGMRTVDQNFIATILSSDPLPTGTVITATARQTSNTGPGASEFSACVFLDPPPLLVNSADDVDDGVCNATHCSLREAMNSANTFTGSGQQFINFAIPPLTGSSEIVITPTTPLPRIARGYLIDGYSQPGSVVNTDPGISNAVPRIRLQGSAGALVGFDVCAANVLIRGFAIAGFEEGIDFKRSGCVNGSGGIVAGNFFGLRSDGSTAAPNLRSLVFDGSGNIPLTVGGSAIADRNVFAGGNIGVHLNHASLTTVRATVLGNLFGSDRSGVQNRAIVRALQIHNATPFCSAGPPSVCGEITVGSADAPNRFRFNGRAVEATGTTIGARFADNHYADSSTLGIDLGGNGVTANDAGDGDSGPNGLVNFPLLTLAERNVDGLRLVGSVDLPGTPAAGTLSIAVYASSACHPGGNGEGRLFLGHLDAGESFDLIVATDADLLALPFITATATHTIEGTSEFSTCRQASDPPVGIAVDSGADSLTMDGGCEVVADANLCTLREAITLANSVAGADRIRFQIPGPGPHVIEPVALLPVIAQALEIDGYSEEGSSPNGAISGFDAVYKIELRPVSLANGLRICTSDLVDIRGIAFVTGTGPMIATQVNATGDCVLSGPLRVRGNQFGIRADGAASAVATAVQANGAPLTAGGPLAADRNLFARSTAGALRIVGTLAAGSVVQNNLFGRDGDGLNHPNARDVEIANAADATIGGEGALANQFFGSAVGVFVSGANADRNRLYANHYALHSGTTAIDLATGGSPDGINANDANDVDSGANDGQNFPLLQTATLGASSITVSGTLDVPAGIVNALDYRLAFYLSTSCSDTPGIGREGETYLGSVLRPFTSTAEGFSVVLDLVPESGFITATATAPDGSTSEFGNCLAAPRPENIHANGFE